MVLKYKFDFFLLKTCIVTNCATKHKMQMGNSQKQTEVFKTSLVESLFNVTFIYALVVPNLDMGTDH